MSCSADDVAAHVAVELAVIADGVVREGLRSRVITPALHSRNWDYGAPGERYPCWTVAADPELDSAIVYSEHGFGPASPWGIVRISDPWYGMDGGWFARLEDAFVDSFMSADLPIWDVVAGGRADAAPLARSLPANEAFYIRDELAGRNPGVRYHVAYRSRPPGGIP